MVVAAESNVCVWCGRYVANKLLEFGDRDQLMKLVERVQGVTNVAPRVLHSVIETFVSRCCTRCRFLL